MIIRSATEKDIASITNLLSQLGYEKSLDFVAQKLKIYLSKTSNYKILVSEEDNKVNGFISIIIYDSLIFSSSMHVEVLVIDENKRGKGIGKKLIQKAQEIAKSNNCELINLITSNKRKVTGTHHFYEKLGFSTHEKDDLTYFSKKLTPNSCIS